VWQQQQQQWRQQCWRQRKITSNASSQQVAGCCWGDILKQLNHKATCGVAAAAAVAAMAAAAVVVLAAR
jgi:hypothetical protein